MAHYFTPSITPAFTHESTKIESLGDVKVTYPRVDGQVLTWDASVNEWVNRANPGLAPPPFLKEIQDVDSSLAPNNGDLLAYSTANSQWEAQAPAPPPALDNLTDVQAPLPVNDNEVLTYDIGIPAWRPKPVPRELNDLSDVSIVKVADDYILSYSGGQWSSNELALSSQIFKDVQVTIPVTDGELLTFDTGVSKWVNTPATILDKTLDDLTNVAAGAPSNGDLLQYNATIPSWENVPISSVVTNYKSQTFKYTATTTAPTGSSSGGFIHLNSANNDTVTQITATLQDAEGVFNQTFFNTFIELGSEVVVQDRADSGRYCRFVVASKSISSTGSPAGILTLVGTTKSGASSFILPSGQSVEVTFYPVEKALYGLTDVLLTPPVSDNDLLQFKTASQSWENVGVSILDKALDDLTDVVISGPVSTGSKLQYDGANWVNVPADPPKEKYAVDSGLGSLSHTALNQKQYVLIDGGLSVGFSGVTDTLTYTGSGSLKPFKISLTGSIYQSVADSRMVAYIEQNGSKIGYDLVSYSKTSTNFAEDSGATSIVALISTGDTLKIAVENLEDIVNSNPRLFLTVEEF